MEKSIVSKILIVGCGLTGSVTTSLIKHEAAADVSIWEKEDHIGKNTLRHRKNIIIWWSKAVTDKLYVSLK